MSQTTNGIATKICPQCGYKGELIDALFFLDTAAMLIPMSVLSLRKFLSRRKDQFLPVYGHYGAQRRRYRVLTGDEVRRIRATLVKGPHRSSIDDLLRRAPVSPEGNESDDEGLVA